MIRLTQVTKFYPTPQGRKYVLKDVSFTIPGGRNVAILGKNGSGKSTLLRMLGGVDAPSSGSIKIDLNISWPMNLDGGLQGSMSARDNARFVCRIQGDDFDRMRARIKAIEDFADLGAYFDMPVKTYSSGMKSKAKLAISAAFDFDCYLLDEIGAVGDALFRKKSEELFANKDKAANFIMVSHSVNDLMEQCDMAIVLHQGEFTGFDDVVEAAEYYYDISGVPIKKGLINKWKRQAQKT